MRRALLIGFALVVTACAGGSSDSTGSSPSSDADSVPSVAEPDTDSSSPAATAAPSPSTTAPAPAEPAVEFREADAAVYAAADEFGADSVEATLVEFAALTGPLPSVPDVQPDETVVPLLTDVIRRIRDLEGQIPAADQEVIDERIDELLGADFAFQLDGTPIPRLDGDDASGESEGPEGFRSPGSSPSVPIDEGDVADGDRAQWISAATRTWGLVAGKLPPPNDLDVAVVVSTPSFWDPAKIEVAREPGAAMIPDVWVQGDSSLALLRERYGDHDCYLVIARAREADPGSDVAISVTAHELFHCWHYTYLGKELPRLYGSGPWVYEGLAAWVGEDISGGTRFSTNWLGRYARVVFPMFESSYDALGFWGRVNEARDLWDQIPALVTTSADESAGAVMEQALGGLDALTPFISSGIVQDISLGFEWSTGPWVPEGVSRTPGRSSASPTDPYVSEVGPGEQTARVVTVDAPDNHMVDLLVTGYSVATWRGGDTSEARAGNPVDLRYCAGRCTCPDGSRPVFDASLPAGTSELNLALSGSGAEGGGATVTVFETECEPEPESADDALLGTWRASPEAVASAFVQASALDGGGGEPVEPLSIAGATGDVLMTFNEGGTGSLEYNDLTLFFNLAPLPDLTINGSGTFTWRGGGDIVITGATYSFTASSTALGGESFTLSSADLPGGGSTALTVFEDGTSLTITAVEGSDGGVFFPQLWFRQSDEG